MRRNDLPDEVVASLARLRASHDHLQREAESAFADLALECRRVYRAGVGSVQAFADALGCSKTTAHSLLNPRSRAEITEEVGQAPEPAHA